MEPAALLRRCSGAIPALLLDSSGAEPATPALFRRWCGKPCVVDHHLWYATGAAPALLWLLWLASALIRR